MPKYKHMLDGFPYVEDVNVYDYENNFDYNLWGVNTVLRVLHVPWDISYEHVVEFETDEKRDKWVKGHTIKEYKLETAINVQPDGEIKLPIPFDVMSKCNYIVVEYPMASIEYEKEDRISTVGYFINNIMQMAPSSTKCYVVQDYWFTYIHDVEITYMDLARGHAPMSMVDADEYLKNPINNCEYLLAPDVNYGYTLSEYTRDRTAGTRVKQIAEWVANSGTIYAVIASTGNSLLSYGTVGTDSMTTPSVNHANFFGCSGFDYICMKETDLNAFLHACNDYRPQYLQTIQGLFFVPEKLIELGGQLDWGEEFSGIDMYFLDTPQKNYKLAVLNKANFGYPAKYERIAKLYTDPYAQIEVSDEYGNISVIAVESTNGKIEINTELNLVYPFLGLDIMFVGLNGEKEDITEYGYSGIRDFSHSGEWYNNIRRYNIPSFIVCQSQSDRIKFDRYYPNKQKEAIYNTRYASGTDDADTRYTNSLVGAQADKDVEYRNADTYYNNLIDEAERDKANRVSSRELNVIKANNQVEFNNKQLFWKANADNISRSYGISAGVNTQVLGIATNLIDMGGIMLTSGASAVSSAISGDIGGVVTGGFTMIGSELSTGLIIGADNTFYDNLMGMDVERFNFLYGTRLSTDPQTDPRELNLWKNIQGSSTIDTHHPTLGVVYPDEYIVSISRPGGDEEAYYCGIYTAQNRYTNDFLKLIKDNTNSMVDVEKTNYKNCIEGGNRLVLDTTPSATGQIFSHLDGEFDGIAPRNQATEKANADTMYNARSGMAGNLKDFLYRDRDRDKSLAQSDIDYGNKNQAVGAPSIYGNAMNSETAASRPLALFVNVRTQSDHAIAAAGDQFCRFGYTLNRSWIPTKLQLMKHFTYWKTNDIWIRCRGNSVEEATEVLQQIFMRGTTVWSKPEDVNSVSIYDNI